jgi:protein-S-isoprenylcysteine O-methyltransferase Ste14
LVLLFSKSFAFGRLAIRMFSPTPALDWTGVALTFVGSILAIWARLILGQNWSAEVSLKAGHELVRSGPYAYIRHPIYAGLLLAVIGTATILGEWRGLAAIALFAIAHGLKARKEERFLSAEFGEEYRQYRERTGSLLPRLQVRMSR